MRSINQKDTVLTYFHTAPQADIAAVLETGRHIVAARFPSAVASEKPKRGRPVGKKPAEPKLSAAVGDQGAS
jgi:hypothetical protein